MCYPVCGMVYTMQAHARMAGPSHSVQCVQNKQGRKEGTFLFNDALNTFYLQLYGIRHMVKDNSDSERGNLLPHRLLFPVSSKGSFICIIPQNKLVCR